MVCSPDRQPDAHHCEDILIARIQAEFREMPGMHLTFRQACRFLDVDAERCRRVLAQLVDKGTLRQQGDIFSYGIPGAFR